jgi:hypothetical protein
MLFQQVDIFWSILTHNKDASDQQMSVIFEFSDIDYLGLAFLRKNLNFFIENEWSFHYLWVVSNERSQ